MASCSPVTCAELRFHTEPCLLRRRFKLPPIFLLPPGIDDCLVHFLCMCAPPKTHDTSASAHPALAEACGFRPAAAPLLFCQLTSNALPYICGCWLAACQSCLVSSSTVWSTSRIMI